MHRYSSRLLFGVTLLLLCLLAGPGIPAELRTQHGIPYMTGGIGKDEVDSMRAQARRFNVRLTLIDDRSGEYLSDVKVRLIDAEKVVRFSIITEGPLLYLSLPRGKYDFVADYRGQMLSIPLSVGRRYPLNINLRFPVNALEDEWVFCERRCPEKSR